MSHLPRRQVGLDVARAIALLGMIAVNFRGRFQPDAGALQEVAWWLDRTEGKWAALFVVLTGVGLGLQAAHASSRSARIRLRRTTLTRAAVLFLLGMLHLHWWNWDILVFYGVYLAASIAFLWARSSTLWVGIGALTLASGWQWMNLTRPQLDFWTPYGAAGKLLFWGNHALLPWFALVLFGMWLARQELRDPGVRLTLATTATVILLAAELANAHVRAGGPGLADPPILDMLRTWPRPTRPGFVVAGPAFATLLVTGSIHFTRGREASWCILALSSTGQLALTLYILHVPAILLPQAHRWAPGNLAALLWYVALFYAASLAAALWWRRRFERGPLEGLVAGVLHPPPRGHRLVSRTPGRGHRHVG